jgi:integrase/recombinase XerD
MTELRNQMIQDMTVRGFSPRTQDTYVRAVRRLAKHYRRSPDTLSVDEVQAYLARMAQVEHLSWSSCSVAVHAFRFLYHVTLGHAAMAFVLPLARRPQRLPEIFSVEEVRRLIDETRSPKHRLLMTTIYACGLRVNEAIHLQTRDIDKDRMMVRVEQGKGQKDRYVPLSKRLLAALDAYAAVCPMQTWVFEGNTPKRPLDISTAQHAYNRAKRRAGITKRGGIHALRHAFATHLIESGTDVLTVQRLLGHRQITSTMRYFHLSQARLTVVRSPLDLLDPPQA